MNKVLHTVNRGIDYLYLFLSSLLFITLIIASAVQVYTRYVLNNSMVGTEELARYCFIWMSLLGGSVAVGRWSHTSITILYDILPPVPKKLLFCFQNLCVIALAVIFIKSGLTMMKATALQSTPTLHIPKKLIYMAVPLCGAGMLLHAVEWIVQSVGEIVQSSRGGKTETEDKK